MKTIAAGKFKASCLALIDEVHGEQVSVIITKRGKAVAKLVPVKPNPATNNFIGCYKGQIEILGNIVSPITRQEDLESMEREWDTLT